MDGTPVLLSPLEPGSFQMVMYPPSKHSVDRSRRGFCCVERKPRVCQASSAVWQVGLPPNGRETQCLHYGSSCSGSIARRRLLSQPLSNGSKPHHGGSRGEAQGSSTIMASGLAPEEAGSVPPSPLVRPLVLPNKQCRDQDRMSPFGMNAYVGTKDSSRLMYF